MERSWDKKMGDRRNYLINQIVKYSLKLDQKGFGANHDGNISAKFEDGLLATPTAISKGDIVADMIITLDMDGKKISGIGKPFSEIKLHLAAYRTSDEIKAVVHAHPPFATALGLVGNSLKPALPEAIVSIGDVVPVAEFAMPGVLENDAIIASMLEQANVFMLQGNGVLAVGDNLEQAYLRLELVEHLAKIQFYAEQMGSPMSLSNENVEELLEKREKAGLGPKGRGQAVSFSEAKQSLPTDSLDNIKKLIAEEIARCLK